MKHIITKITPILLIAGSAHAELAWVKGSFWQAPYEKNVVVKVKPTGNMNLQKICASYQNSVAPGGKVFLSKSEVDYRRKAAEGFSWSDFSVTFAVDAEGTQAANASSVDLANQSLRRRETKDLLPHFTQEVDNVIPTLQPKSEIGIHGKPGSLLEISKKLGLDAMDVTIGGEDTLATIKVYGRDAACDLWRGNAVITFDSDARVSISRESYKRVDDFYRGIEGLTKEIFQKKKSNSGRAALFGFKMAGVLARELRVDESELETMTGNLTEFLFDGNMQRSQIWTTLGSEQSLTIYGSAVGPVNVRLEK